MADSMEPCKMLWVDPCCHGNEISERRGDPVAYRLVYYFVVFGVDSDFVIGKTSFEIVTPEPVFGIQSRSA